MISNEQIVNVFGYHRPDTDEAQRKHEETRAQFIEFAQILRDLLKDVNDRYALEAFGKLHEASMWAHFALAEQNPLVWGETYKPVEPPQ